MLAEISWDTSFFLALTFQVDESLGEETYICSFISGSGESWAKANKQ